MKLKQIIIIILINLLLSMTHKMFSQINKPNWLINRPVDHEYYIGIGHCTLSHENYQNIAVQNAIEEISSQIEIKIESSIFKQLSEENDNVINIFRKRILTFTDNEIKNVQIYDSSYYEGIYWVYCRLSKIEYENRILLEKEVSITNSLIYMNKANNCNSFIESLNLYFKAFSAVENFSNENVMVEQNGINIDIIFEIKNSISQLLNDIIINTKNSEIVFKYGNDQKRTLIINLLSNNFEYLSDIPISIENIKGNILSDKKLITDINGSSTLNIYGIESSEYLQIIRIQIDRERISKNIKASPIFDMFLDSFNYPQAKIFIKVQMLKCYVKSNELILNEYSNTKYIENKVKNILALSGIQFTDNISDADIMIEIDANSRSGNELFGLFSAFADCSVNCISLDDGNEIFSKSMNNVRGFDVNYKKASLKALEEISNTIDKTFFNELIQILIN